MFIDVVRLYHLVQKEVTAYDGTTLVHGIVNESVIGLLRKDNGCTPSLKRQIVCKCCTKVKILLSHGNPPIPLRRYQPKTQALAKISLDVLRTISLSTQFYAALLHHSSKHSAMRLGVDSPPNSLRLYSYQTCSELTIFIDHQNTRLF